MDDKGLWSRFKNYYITERRLGFSLDVSRVKFEDSIFTQPAVTKALQAMDQLEKGAIANPDENRMVGHYWLRDPQLAPSNELKEAIVTTLSKIKSFAADVHSGKVSPASGKKFRTALVIGIGGSALGPQFVYNALGTAADPLKLYFFDNTDPDGMVKTIESIPNLSETLCIVISKSGGTKETRNGQLIAKKAWQQAGAKTATHFIAITGEGSELDKTATAEKWLAKFPMWDWVGGRTSELSAVGLLPAALQGAQIDDLLTGAREMDKLTRNTQPKKNPAMLLALMWYQIGGGKGLKDMVVLPYKDRFELISRYLQQLVMESLGKQHDLAGKEVEQGIAVYGNKGSTDQHAYVQQLRDGVHNFFVTFIEVVRDATPFSNKSELINLEVEQGVTSGDYLSGFYLGTRKALYDKSRESISITVREVNAQSVGMLIALFERAVGFYASLVNINAYHQPGVEAGKKAAADVLLLQHKVVTALQSSKEPLSVDSIAQALNMPESSETIFKIVQHLAANARVRVSEGADIFSDRYSVG